jgi:hypothetical protein
MRATSRPTYAAVITTYAVLRVVRWSWSPSTAIAICLLARSDRSCVRLTSRLGNSQICCEPRRTANDLGDGPLLAGAGDVLHDRVGGVTVKRLASAVVAQRRAWVRVTGELLHITK